MRENRSLSMDLIWEEQCLPLLTMALGLFVINTLSRSSSRPVLRCAVCVSTRFRRELSSFFNYLLCGGILTCQAAAPGGQQTDEAPGQLGCAWGLLAGGRWETRPCSQHGAPSALKGVLFQLKKKKESFMPSTWLLCHGICLWLIPLITDFLNYLISQWLSNLI